MIATITPMEALRRLIAEVKQLDAVEVGARWNQLQGELGVAEGVVRDYVPESLQKPDGTCKRWCGDGECKASCVSPSAPAAAPVAAKPSEEAQPVPELREVLRDSLASGLTNVYYCGRAWNAWNVGTMTQDDFTEASEIDEIVDELCDLAIAVLAPTAAVSAAPSGEVERDTALNALLNHVIDDFREMNPSNYTHDEACDLNNWGVEAVGLAQAVQDAITATKDAK